MGLFVEVKILDFSQKYYKLYLGEIMRKKAKCDTAICGTCRYWEGERQFIEENGKFYYKMEKFGKCMNFLRKECGQTKENDKTCTHYCEDAT